MLTFDRHRPDQDRARGHHEEGATVEAISDLPMLNDIDADYAPQYVKLARILRTKIDSGEYKTGDRLPASDLAREHNVSIKVAWRALAMLAANRYLARPAPVDPYHVTSDHSHAHPQEHR
jgi:DNA-binding transcriptional regulator YhcF (GntR family)